MRFPRFGDSLSLILELVGAVAVVVGVWLQFGAGVGLIAAGAAIAAVGVILDV